MKRYRDVPKTGTYRELVLQTCGLCGRESMQGGPVGDNWDREYYAVNETEVRVKWQKGSSYPDGGSTQTYKIDVCPDCFKDKLIPWLRSQGAEIELTAVDW